MDAFSLHTTMSVILIVITFGAIILTGNIHYVTASPGQLADYNYSGAGATEQRLIAHLLDNYDTDARGVMNASHTVKVEIQLLLLRIQGLEAKSHLLSFTGLLVADEISQVLTTTGLLICDWQDDRLRWNKEEFDNLEDIVIRPERIWLPELALMNGAEELAPDFHKIRILVSHTGKVHWEPGGIFTTTCDIDIRYFPFDDQSCPIQFGAWAYHSHRMNITNSSDIVQTHDFSVNGEWDVYKTKSNGTETILPCCPDMRYSYVEFTLYLRRRYTFYMMNIILPCTLLSILVMIVFCLPPDAGEKISLGISVLLAFTVFLLMVAENVPRTSLHIPVMVIYLTCTMALGTVSVCLTVLVLNLHHRDAERPVPRWARVLILKYLAAFICVHARKPKTMAGNLLFDSPEHGHSHNNSVNIKSGLRRIARDAGLLRPILTANGDLTGNGPAVNNADLRYTLGDQVYPHTRERRLDKTHEWKEIAHVLDRFFFWIVFVFMSASALVILLVPVYKECIAG